MTIDNEIPDIQVVTCFMEFSYSIRHNNLSDCIEFKKIREVADEYDPEAEFGLDVDYEGKEYIQLTDRHLNSIIRSAMNALPYTKGVKGYVKDYIGSEDVEQYNPVAEYIESLPEWDGHDYIREFFSRIPDVTKTQLKWLYIWFLSMVAHWMDLDTRHGNECVPVLIGEQGCGKTTFCNLILPDELSQYYLDNFNLTNCFSKDMTLTSNLLVNIDEMDKIKQTQQAELKHSLSRKEVNGRPIYGRMQVRRKRYASFVGTTNNPHPLTDPTGSRRFICVRIPDGKYIVTQDEEGNPVPVNYGQLYAQAVAAIKAGERYWFNNEETLQIQEANTEFQSVQDLGSMVEICFRHPKEGENEKFISVKEVIDTLCQQFPSIKKSRSMSINVGLTLKELGYHRKVKAQGNFYDVIPVTPAWRED